MGVGAPSYDGRVDNGGLRTNNFGSLLRGVEDGVGVTGVGIVDSTAGEGRAVPGVLSGPGLLSMWIMGGGMWRRGKCGTERSSSSSSSESLSSSSELMPPSSSKAGPVRWERRVPIPSVWNARSGPSREDGQRETYGGCRDKTRTGTFGELAKDAIEAHERMSIRGCDEPEFDLHRPGGVRGRSGGYER